MQNHINSIIQQAKEGNKSAFKNLVDHYQKYAFNLAFRVLYNEEDAKDVVQDSFIKIWINIKHFNSGMPFTTWMYKIVMNTAIDKQKSLKRFEWVKEDEILNLLTTIECDGPDCRLDNEQLGSVIKKIADELPEKQRLVFILRDLQDLESSVVEELLDLSETSVKANLYHARQVLRKKLESFGEQQRRR